MPDAERIGKLSGTLPFVAKVIVLPGAGSTQDEARRLAAEGAPEGTVVLACGQSAGRGSRGRSWFSPPGKGLYLSIVLRPGGEPALRTRWTLAASLAVCRTAIHYRVDAGIKWPNDVRVGGRKLAGILAESREEPAGPVLILGIGINVFHGEQDFPKDLRKRSTSLRIEGAGEILWEDLVGHLLDGFSGIHRLMYHDGWAAVLEDWTALAPGVRGRPVRVAGGPDGCGTLRGTTAGVDRRGALIVRLEDGRTVKVHSSESLIQAEE